MPLPQWDATVGHSFGLEFDGILIQQIQEITGLKIEQDVIEMKTNTPDGRYFIRKLPGRPKAGEVVLTRGMTADNSFQNWVKASHIGDMVDARKGGSIIVYDYMGSVVKRYKVTNAWAKSLELSSMKAGDASVLTEKLTLTYETIEPE